MTRKIRTNRISPAMIVSCVALFLALTGSALAVGLAKNSVRSPQIVNGAVQTVDLRDAAVTSQKLAENSVDSLRVENGSLTGSDIADNTITSADIAPHAVGAGQLGAIAVRTNSTTVAKGAFGGVSVSCAAGEQVIGGGAQPGHFGTEMTSSRPSGNGWLYQAVNNTSGEETLTVFALCLAG